MEVGFAKVNLSLFLGAMGWREQKEGSKQDGAWGGVVCPKPRRGKSTTRLHAHPIPKHLGRLSARGEPASFPQPLPLFGAQELRSCTVSKKLPWQCNVTQNDVFLALRPFSSPLRPLPECSLDLVLRQGWGEHPCPAASARWGAPTMAAPSLGLEDGQLIRHQLLAMEGGIFPGASPEPTLKGL